MTLLKVADLFMMSNLTVIAYHSLFRPACSQNILALGSQMQQLKKSVFCH